MDTLSLNTRKKPKKIKTIIVSLIIFFLISFSCFVSYDDIELKENNKKLSSLNKDYKEKIKSLKEENEKLSESNKSLEEKVSVLTVDTYYVSYSSYTKLEDRETELNLNGDNTFSFDFNTCFKIEKITGDYTKDENKIVLNKLNGLPADITGSELTEITFDILDDGKLKLNNSIGCILNESLFTRKG